MEFKFVHNNFNVLDLERSLKFYAEALKLKEVRRIAPASGEFIIVYLSDGSSKHLLELTWMRDRTEPYDLGDRSSTSPSRPTTTPEPSPNTRPWAASPLRIKRWASTSFRIPTTTGLKYSRPNKYVFGCAPRLVDSE